MKKREIGIDIIKIWAALAVVGVHHYRAIGFYQVVYNNEINMFFTTFLYIFFLTCVPLFIITSGYLMSGRKVSIDYYKKITYFLAEVFLIILSGFFVYYVLKGEFSVYKWLAKSVNYFLAPAYYIGVYVGIYLIAPFLNKFYYSLNKSEKIGFLIVLLLTISLPKVLNIPSRINFFDQSAKDIWMVLYYFIGLYIKDFQPKISKLKNIFLLILFALLFSLSINSLLIGQNYSSVLGYYEGIFTVLISSLSFILLYKIEIKSVLAKKIIIVLSSSTLTYYLLCKLIGDPIAMRYLNISGDFFVDFYTIIPKMLLSFVIVTPIAIFIYLINNQLKRFLGRYI